MGLHMPDMPPGGNYGRAPPPPCNPPPLSGRSLPWRRGGGHEMMVPPMEGGGGGLHHTIVALNLQQLQCNLKKIFLWRLVFPMLFCQSDGPPSVGGIARGGVVPVKW